MQRWHIYRENKTHGPFTPMQLKQFAAAGKLRPSDIVGLVGSDERFQAMKVSGLFDGSIESSSSSTNQTFGTVSGGPFYVRMKGRAIGPFAHEHLQKLATNGSLSRFHELSSDGISWGRAESFGIQFGTQTALQPNQRHFHSDISPAGRASVHVQSSQNPAQMDAKEWHIHIAGVTHDPVSQQELNRLLEEGRIGDDAFLWRTGFDSWLPLHEAIGLYSTKADVKAKSAFPRSEFHIDLNDKRLSRKVAVRGQTKAFHCWTFSIGLIFFALLFAVFSEHANGLSNKRQQKFFSAETGMVVAMFGMFGFFGYGAYIVYGIMSRCPKCNSWWAAEIEKIDEKGRRLGYDNVTEIDRHKNRDGTLVGTTERQVQVRVEEVFTTEYYACRFCCHRWNQDAVRRYRL